MNAWDVIVLKFGSSVLSSAADLPNVVDEIYRHLREAKRVLAVVSAFEDQTDKLLAEAYAAIGEDAPPEADRSARGTTEYMRRSAERRTRVCRSSCSARLV